MHVIFGFLSFQRAELDEKARQMMVLKFGRVVNLEALEGLATNKLIGELEDQLQAQEAKLEKERRTIEVNMLATFTTREPHRSSCYLVDENDGSQTDAVGRNSSQHTKNQSILSAAHLQQAARKAAEC